VSVKVHLVIRGRIGDDWMDIDRELQVPDGTTLGRLIEIADARGIPLTRALADSPHLSHTLMLNGERCPVDEHRDHALGDGDQIYLLAPLAGG
jgi:molybdopterin converting factor small subunit